MAQSIKNVVLTTTFTRPSDTTPYTAEDSVNATGGVTTPLTMSVQDNIPINNGSSYKISSARLVTNSSNVTNGSFRLMLYDKSVAGFADNSPKPLQWANRTNRVGYIDFTLATGGSGSDCSESLITAINISMRSEGTVIYGELIAKGAYTPASAQQFYIEVNAEQLDA